MNAPASSSVVRPQLAAMELIRTLVAFNTTSRDSNQALIDWVRDYLAVHGIDSQLTFDDDRRKANLFATLPASDGNVKERGIVLSGHTDVVPVDGQPWSSDPFALHEASGRLYGRGACDMKGFDACVLAMVPTFKASALKRPVHIVLSYDEETTCLGSRDVIAWFGLSEPRPGAVIVGEPTMMEVADAHKSVA